MEYIFLPIKKIIKNKILVISVIVAIGCGFFSILFNLKSDYIGYSGWYANLDGFGIKACQGWEPFFCLISIVLHESNFPFEWWVFFWVFIQYFLAFLFLIRGSQKTPIFVGFFFLTVYFSLVVQPPMASHLIRQYVATSFLLMAASFRPKLIRSLFLVFSILLHFSALFFIFPYIFRVFSKKVLISLFLLAFIFLFGLYISQKNIVYENVYFSKVLTDLKYKAILYREVAVSPDFYWKYFFVVFLSIFAYVQLSGSSDFDDIFLKDLLSVAVGIGLFSFFIYPVVSERYYHYMKIFLWANFFRLYLFKYKNNYKKSVT